MGDSSGRPVAAVAGASRTRTTPALALRPGAGGWPTDVCVPISNLAECILETRADVDASGLLAPIVGHVGDGNFHPVVHPRFPTTPASSGAPRPSTNAWLRALWTWAEPARASTASGTERSGFSIASTVPEAVSVMRQVKQALDPENLMNPGKIIPATRGIIVSSWCPRKPPPDDGPAFSPPAEDNRTGRGSTC